MNTPSIPYEQARIQVHTGDLLLFRGTWRSSLLIRWWTSGRWFGLAPFSHVGIACWVQLELAGVRSWRLCCMESVGGGVRVVPLAALVNLERAVHLEPGGGRHPRRPATGPVGSLVLEVT